MDESLALYGKLSFISLADIFQILGGNNCTGILTITSQYTPNPGQIFFVNGNPINASCDQRRGRDALFPLFGWLDGKFEFHEKEVRVKPIINQSRMEIVLDALKMLDDGEIKTIGPLVGFDGENIKKDTMPLVKGPIADYSYISEEEEFEEGRLIVKEGKFGKWIWVVLEGTAEVRRETANGPRVISRLGEGSFIGTFSALLFGDYTRKSTIVAQEKVYLGLLDTDRLSKEFYSLSQEFRELLLSLDNRLLKITNSAVALYSKTKHLTLPKKTKDIIKRGSSKRKAYSITNGEAYVVGQTRKGDFPLIVLEKESVFGDIPFLDIGHEPRSASVVASAELGIKPLDVESLQKEYDKLSNMFRSFIYNVCICISNTTRLAHNLYTKGKEK